MGTSFGIYPWIYANKKSKLLTLIEKYYGASVRNMTHGQVIDIYHHLLTSDDSFLAEVNLLVPAKYKNAADPVTAIGDALSGLFKIGSGAISSAANADAEFAQATLAAQKAKNRQTLIIVASIAIVSLSVIGLGIYLAVKKKK